MLANVMYSEKEYHPSRLSFMMTPQNDENRRAHERIFPPYNTLVYNGEIFGQLIDIGRGGLSFAYSKNETNVRDQFLELDIMCGTRKLHIPSVFCKTTNDYPIHQKEIDKKHNIRRRCLQFGSMSPDQQQLLQEFMESTRPLGE